MYDNNKRESIRGTGGRNIGRHGRVGSSGLFSTQSTVVSVDYTVRIHRHRTTNFSNMTVPPQGQKVTASLPVIIGFNIHWVLAFQCIVLDYLPCSLSMPNPVHFVRIVTLSLSLSLFVCGFAVQIQLSIHVVVCRRF